MKNTSSTSLGILYLVATPIGNLDDISNRAIDTLKKVDVILAEDTRHSLHLLTNLGIKKTLQSLHAHNETQKSEQIILSLLQGQSFALISDAGTPLISDPGFTLVRMARQNDIQVIPIPGPCALITALCGSGIPCDTFTFIGFLPAKSQARLSKLETLLTHEYTVVIYESTHRINKCIDDITTVYGKDYSFVLAKELTKTFEHFIHATGPEINHWFNQDTNRLKGEFVLILPAVASLNNNKEDSRLLTLLLKELPLKQAVKLASIYLDKPKNELYKIALTLQQND